MAICNDDIYEQLIKISSAAARVEEKLDTVVRKVAEHEDEIEGNGRPGLKDQVAELQRVRKSWRGAWKELRGALVGAVVAAAVGYAVGHLSVSAAGAQPPPASHEH